MRPYILAETNWKAIKDLKVEVAVLPWGATEAHNYHMPYATDNIEGEAFAAEAARLAWEQGTKAVVLPAIPFGVNTGQDDILLNLTLYPSTQKAILHDIIEVLNRHGIYKLLVTTNFFNIVDKDSFFEEKGDHADEMETSLLLHLRPDLVRPLEEAGPGLEKKSRIKGIREGWAWSERKWSMVSASLDDPRNG